MIKTPSQTDPQRIIKAGSEKNIKEVDQMIGKGQTPLAGGTPADGAGSVPSVGVVKKPLRRRGAKQSRWTPKNTGRPLFLDPKAARPSWLLDVMTFATLCGGKGKRRSHGPEGSKDSTGERASHGSERLGCEPARLGESVRERCASARARRRS